MNETRKILRHFLAALAYRTQKAVRGAPEGFGDFRAGNGVRTPVELLAHMNMLIRYARTFFIGGSVAAETPQSLESEIALFHEALHNLSSDLQSPMPIEGVTYEQMLQGPLADAMTHAGQLAMIRRLAGDPVEAENFVLAPIRADNVGTDQPNSG